MTADSDSDAVALNERRAYWRARAERQTEALEEIREIVEGWTDPILDYEQRNAAIQRIVGDALFDSKEGVSS